MYQYSLYGCSITSSMEFPQLLERQDVSGQEINILEGGIPEDIRKAAETEYYVIGKEVSWFQNGTGVFYIHDGNTIRYELRENANLQYARTYILGYGVSMVLLQNHILTIHCSAVANDEGAILIAGESGAGKSTLTTNYLKAGYRLLADDIAAVKIDGENRVMAYPAFPYQKLCRDRIDKEDLDRKDLIYIDEQKDKFLVSRKEQFMEKPVPVKLMLLLTLSRDTKLEGKEIQGINKLFAIRENLFLKRLVGDWLSDTKVVQKCLDMGSKVPIYMVKRPIAFDTIDQIKEFIEQMVSVTV